jgi:hypothetical protein
LPSRSVLSALFVLAWRASLALSEKRVRKRREKDAVTTYERGPNRPAPFFGPEALKDDEVPIAVDAVQLLVQIVYEDDKVMAFLDKFPQACLYA